jgi:hypothetical protein
LDERAKEKTCPTEANGGFSFFVAAAAEEALLLSGASFADSSFLAELMEDFFFVNLGVALVETLVCVEFMVYGIYSVCFA